MSPVACKRMGRPSWLVPVVLLSISIGDISIDVFSHLSFESMTTFQICNTAEGVFWILIGAGFGINCLLTREKDKQTRIVAMILFVAFGISDFVQATVGAWWRPWWLLCWKAICVAGLTIMTLRRWHQKRIALRQASPGVDSCDPLDRGE